MADEGIGGVDGMLEARHDAVVEVGQGDAHIDRAPGHGHVVAGLERLGHAGGLLGGQPLLEERGEGVHKELAPRLMVVERYLPIAPQGHVGEVCASARPLGRGIGMLEEHMLLSGRAGKHIVEAQRAPVEVIVEGLGLGEHRHQAKGER